MRLLYHKILKIAIRVILVDMKRDDFIYGVNLGGWLVLERWITPSLFAGMKAEDEWSYMQETTDAKTRIERHRQDFITEADFKWIARSGLNAVRLPL